MSKKSRNKIQNLKNIANENCIFKNMLCNSTNYCMDYWKRNSKYIFMIHLIEIKYLGSLKIMFLEEIYRLFFH